MDWDKLILIGMNARSKVKKEVGPQSKYRELMGAVVLMSLKKFDYRQAKDIGFLDPKELMSDTTAQEAKTPYPTEVGLMSGFVGRVKKQLGKAGKVFTKVKLKVKEVLKKVKGLSA